MGRTSLVYYAAAIALVLPASAGAASQPVTLTGEDIAAECTPDRGAAYCTGYLNALRDLAGDRYSKRGCPPPIVENGAEYPRAIVLKYLREHPEAKSRNAIDIVFDAETESMSRDFGRDCSKK
jgi:hypothetical protein